MASSGSASTDSASSSSTSSAKPSPSKRTATVGSDCSSSDSSSWLAGTSSTAIASASEKKSGVSCASRSEKSLLCFDLPTVLSHFQEGALRIETPGRALERRSPVFVGLLLKSGQQCANPDIGCHAKVDVCGVIRNRTGLTNGRCGCWGCNDDGRVVQNRRVGVNSIHNRVSQQLVHLGQAKICG